MTDITRIENIELRTPLEVEDMWIARVKSMLATADKLQDSAFRSGLQLGFSLGQTDDQKGYEQSMAAYSPNVGPRSQNND